MTARILNLTPAEYRADPLDGVPWLSQSIAHVLLSQSPLHAWTQHRLLGGIGRPSTAALNDGQIIHRLLLGKGADIAVAPPEWPDAKGKMVPAVEWRTNSAKEWKANALAEGKLPLLEHEAAEFFTTAEAIKARVKSLGLPLGGDAEVGVTWDETGEKGPVRCTAMMDLADIDKGVIIDIKTTRNAHPQYVRRAFTEYGYAIQGIAYIRAVEALKPELAGRVKMLFLFCELDPPYGILPAVMGPAMREYGETQWKKAVLTWERCLMTDDWPDYAPKGGDVVEIEPMPYALARQLDEAIEETARD